MDNLLLKTPVSLMDKRFALTTALLSLSTMIPKFVVITNNQIKAVTGVGMQFSWPKICNSHDRQCAVLNGR